MMNRGVNTVLKLQWRARAFATRAAGAQAACSHTPHAMRAETDDVFDGFSSFAAIRGAPIFSAGASCRDPTSSPRLQHTDASCAVLPGQPVVCSSVEHALVDRLASVWQIPAEILHSNVRALADLLQPCGRNTCAHALWAMVRCPELRHADEQQLRINFKHLTQMVEHLDLDKPTLLATVYRRPWMLRAAKAAAMRARAQARAANATKRSSCNTTNNSSSNGSSSDAEDSAERSSSTSNGRYVAPWNQELALLLLEMHANSTSKDGSSSSSSHASPTLALAAVRSYVAAAEAAFQLSNAVKSATQGLLPLPVFSSAFSWINGKHQQTEQSAAASAASSTTPDYHTTTSQAQERRNTSGTLTHFSSSSSTTVVQQQQCIGHLDQLVKVCPPLTLLPPEIMAYRWQLLLSGLLGSHQSAASLLMANPYLMVSYADFQRVDCPYEVDGY